MTRTNHTGLGSAVEVTEPRAEPAEPLGSPAGEPEAWSLDDAAQTYGFDAWGKDEFVVGPRGTVLVTPDGAGDGRGVLEDSAAVSRSIDLAEVMAGLRERGIAAPVLVRFPDLLDRRMRAIRAAFDAAREEEQYTGGYSCVYPIKVNQQRHWVETLRETAKPLGFGLEAGSKAELLAVIALTENCGPMPVVCNGFKDDEYIETVILAHTLGRHITPVIESLSELDLLLRHAKNYGVRPRVGVRIKPFAPGAGRWSESSGERSKFGLHASEVLTALEILKANGMEDRLRMVHCHAGSQICDIKKVKSVVIELARVYCELRRLGAGVDTIDVGGGLAIDYDGSRSDWANSTNYSLSEYARDVVYRIKQVCDEADQPHPDIITESGRALAASSSVLVFDVVGRTRFRGDPDMHAISGLLSEAEERAEDVPQPIRDLVQTWEDLRGWDPNSERRFSLAEAYHDANQGREEAVSLFNLGYLSLPMRAAAERLFWAINKRVLRLAEETADPALDDELVGMTRRLSDIYFCNFSLFQSLPDSWAIDQLFPIAPIQRLNERPARPAILTDITCDSDGTIDRFTTSINTRDFNPVLPLHDLDPAGASAGEPYYLAVFLVGAYQEVLGDLHNLFGDTHAVHVKLDDEAGWRIEEVIEGDTVREVLEYVQYKPDELKQAVRREVERAVRQGSLTVAQSRSLMRFYESGLEGYTYLEQD